MNKILHDGLLSEVKKLKEITSELEIEGIINFVAMQLKSFSQREVGKKHLSSPLRQGMYLLAICCNQGEPSNVEKIDQGKYDKIIDILNSIFNRYFFAYFPDDNDVVNDEDSDWYKDRRVSMPAFINYFAAGMKISTDQIKSWIEFYFNGFDDDIYKVFNISYSEMIAVGEYFEGIIQSNFDEVEEAIRNIENFRQSFVESGDKENVLSGMSNNPDLKKSIEKFHHGTNEIHACSINDLEKVFGERIKSSILNFFTTVRGASEEIKYITDDNPLLKKPLLRKLRLRSRTVVSVSNSVENRKILPISVLLASKNAHSALFRGF